jgi:hypothetical protein
MRPVTRSHRAGSPDVSTHLPDPEEVARWFTLHGHEPHSHPGVDRARAILAEWYARGEISRDEYRERLDDLD